LIALLIVHQLENQYRHLPPISQAKPITLPMSWPLPSSTKTMNRDMWTHCTPITLFQVALSCYYKKQVNQIPPTFILIPNGYGDVLISVMLTVQLPREEISRPNNPLFASESYPVQRHLSLKA
jgi:hypothetical protein